MCSVLLKWNGEKGVLGSFFTKRKTGHGLGFPHRPHHRFYLLFCVTSFHSSTLAWKIPWTEEPGGLQSMGSRRVRHDWATSLSLFTFTNWRRQWQPTPAFLPGESQGWRSLVGCRLWGRTESDTTEATWQQWTPTNKTIRLLHLSPLLSWENIQKCCFTADANTGVERCYTKK